MEETRRATGINKYNIALFLLSLCTVLLFSIIKKDNIYVIIGKIITIGVTALLCIFTKEKEVINNNFVFDNEKKQFRYYIMMYIGIVLSIVFSFFPSTGWPYIVLFIVLSLLSSSLTGAVSGLHLLMICLLIYGEAQPTIFLTYFVAGIVAVILFSTVDNEFNVLNITLLALFLQFVMLCMLSILFNDQPFSFNSLIIPIMNIIVCALSLLVCLKAMSYSLTYKVDDIYMDILDTDFELMGMLKGYSKEEFDHSLYTSVLCSKVATELNLNANVVKACGYYYKIGLIRGKDSWDNTEELLNKYNFPIEVIDVLDEYYHKETKLISKEAAVLYFADNIITSIIYLLTKDQNAKIDYEKLINAIFEKRIASGILVHSKLSFDDISVMKKTLINQDVFYDFLKK